MIEMMNSAFLLKLAYFLETYVYALDGKFHLLTPYLIFHHSTLPFCIWLANNYNPGGHFILAGVINLVAHIILMVYNVTTQIWPELKTTGFRNFVAKSYVTHLGLIFLHGLQLFFYNPCKFPLSLNWFGMTWGTIIIILNNKAQKKSKVNGANGNGVKNGTNGTYKLHTQ